MGRPYGGGAQLCHWGQGGTALLVDLVYMSFVVN